MFSLFFSCTNKFDRNVHIIFEAQTKKTWREQDEAEKLVAKPKIIRHSTNCIEKDWKLNSPHFTIHQRGEK